MTLEMTCAIAKMTASDHRCHTTHAIDTEQLRALQDIWRTMLEALLQRLALRNDCSCCKRSLLLSIQYNSPISSTISSTLSICLALQA